MSFPFEYDHGAPLVFGGALPNPTTFDDSRVVVLPVPVDRTTSYVPGTRNGPREILQASSHMELWDEETGRDVSEVGIFTLPEMELPFGELEPLMAEIRRVASEVISRDKFLVASATQVGIRSLSTEEAKDLPGLKTRIFYDHSMRRDQNWIDAVVESLGDPVYLTIDVDGMDPAIMPATGTPEPGGLSWYETLALIRATMAKRTVVACDVVELSPLPGVMAPNFLCAKLVYKILAYRFASR